MTESCRTHECVMAHSWLGHVTDMDWSRLVVRSLQLQVSFANEPYKRDYILRKRPIILRSLLIVWLGHVTDMDGSYHTYERYQRQYAWHRLMQGSRHTCTWVMAHGWMSGLTHMYESCHTYVWVMSHICSTRDTAMQCVLQCVLQRVLQCVLPWVVSHICMSHVTHQVELWHTYKRY